MGKNLPRHGGKKKLTKVTKPDIIQVKSGKLAPGVKDWRADFAVWEGMIFDRLLRLGTESLTEREAVALIVGANQGGDTATDLSNRLFAQFTDLKGMAGVALKEFISAGLTDLQILRVVAMFRVAQAVVDLRERLNAGKVQGSAGSSGGNPPAGAGQGGH